MRLLTGAVLLVGGLAAVWVLAESRLGGGPAWCAPGWRCELNQVYARRPSHVVAPVPYQLTLLGPNDVTATVYHLVRTEIVECSMGPHRLPRAPAYVGSDPAAHYWNVEP